MKEDHAPSSKLREIVDSIRRTGLPTAQPASYLAKMTGEQQRIMDELMTLAEHERPYGDRKAVSESPHFELRRTIRAKLREAIEADMLILGLIQRQAIGYGAIPHSNDQWRYYRTLENDGWKCWTCGEDILCKTVNKSVHDSGFSLRGSGEVRQETVPYCPSCDREPRDGFINESLAEALQRDMR